MTKITIPQIICFILLLVVIITFGAMTTYLLFGSLPLGDFRGIFLSILTVIMIYLYAFIVYRLFLTLLPLGQGRIVQGTQQEFSAQVNILFYLLLFNSLIRTHFIPVPILRLIYLALGAKLGENTYSAGVILDPPLTEIGSNCIIGHDAVLFSHAIEGVNFSLEAIKIGNNVTIGAKAVVMSGVTISDGAIVSAGAIVLKGSKIGVNEIWGGVPAKRIK